MAALGWHAEVEMTRRTITVTLTEAQFRALGSAVAIADGENEVTEPLTAWERGQAKARDNAWSNIKRAWYSRARS